MRTTKTAEIKLTNSYYEPRAFDNYGSKAVYREGSRGLHLQLKAKTVTDRFDSYQFYLIYSDDATAIDAIGLLVIYGNKAGDKNKGKARYNLVFEAECQLPGNLPVQLDAGKVQLYFHNNHYEKGVAEDQEKLNELLAKFQVILEEYPNKYFTSKRLNRLLEYIDPFRPGRPQIPDTVVTLEERYLEDMLGEDDMEIEPDPNIPREPDQSNGGIVVRMDFLP